MATTKITNTQIKDLVNEAYKQATGKEGVDVQLDLTDFTETGAFNTDFTLVREKFTGALIARLVKNFYLDSAYSADDDPFYMDSAEFGAITQWITATVPMVRNNSAWENFVNGATIGTAEVALPVISSKLTCASTSWGLPLTISSSQWNDAVKSQEEFNSLVSYIMMCVQNAIQIHRENCNSLNRNNLFGELINATNTSVAGVHTMNLVEEYAKENGETSMTVEDFLSNADALRFAYEKVKTLTRYLGKMTATFNTEGHETFVPKDRLVVQLLGMFVDKVESKMLSNTFHAEMADLDVNYSTVASWQSLEDISFDGVSSINVKTADGHEIEKAGIIGIICDRWAVAHTIVSERVGHLRDDIKDLDHYEYQFKDRRVNNMGQSAILLMLDDYTA